jgi:hypothetical protein
MHDIRIGSEGADFFRLSIRERQFPEAADYWNANFLVSDLEISAGAFRGAFGAVIRNEDLERFLRQLRLLYERASGGASLEVSDWLSLDILAEGHSQMKVWCQVDDGHNNLEGRWAFERAGLLTIIEQIETVCSVYPVVAHTDAEPGPP